MAVRAQQHGAAQGQWQLCVQGLRTPTPGSFSGHRCCGQTRVLPEPMSWKNLPLRAVVPYANQYKINGHHHLTFKPFFILIWTLLCQRLGDVVLARCSF